MSITAVIRIQTGALCRSVLLLSLFPLFLFAGCGKSDSESADLTKTLIMAHGMHNAHPVAKAMGYMAERVEEHSEGKLNIEMYPNRQLGSERELLELVQIGSVAMTKVSGAKLENIVPEIKVFSLPYLFRGSEHMNKVFNSEIGDQILQKGAAYGLKGLAYYNAGFRSFYTVDTPIRKPEDLQGLKIRVQESQMAIQIVNALGAAPTPLAYGELYTALQGGVVDGAENNAPSFHTARHYEVCGYYSLDEHTAVPDFLLISTNVWNSLSDQEQKWLSRAVEESVEKQEQLWGKAVEEAMTVVKEAGVEIIRPDKEPFQEAVQPIYENFREDYPEVYKWVEKIQKVQVN